MFRCRLAVSLWAHSLPTSAVSVSREPRNAVPDSLFWAGELASSLKVREVILAVDFKCWVQTWYDAASLRSAHMYAVFSYNFGWVRSIVNFATGINLHIDSGLVYGYFS